MAKMQVEGKVPVEVPLHLSGAVAAGNEKRIVSHLIDTGIVVAIYLLFMILPTMAISNAADYEALESALSTATTMWVIGVLVLIALSIAQLVLVATKGQTIAMKMTGLRWVSFTDGNISGGSAFGKIMLESVINSFAMGLAAPVIWLVSQDEMNRHWFARVTNIITINIKDGRDTAFVPPSVENDEHEPDRDQPWSPTSASPSSMLPESIPAPPVVSAPATNAGSSAVINEVPGSPSTDNPYAPPMGSTTSVPPVPASPYAPAPTEPPASYQPPAPMATPATPTPTAAPASPYAPPAPMPPAPVAVPAMGNIPAAPADEVDRTVARRPVDSILLTFDDGTHHFLVGQALVGRAPEPEPGHPNAQMVSLHDPGRSISKIHIALSVQSGAVLVEDMHSMNGTTVMFPSGTTQAVLPGAPVLAPAGATIYFGDRSVKIGG